ncbi:MAG: spermine synthase [Legionella sp.]|nr:MAG: spermine synthase [Legionella sp.]PJD98403.1 MAG: spermine synthase [Legionella sp.]
MLSSFTHSNRNEKDFLGDPIIYRTRDSWGEILVIDRRTSRVLAFDPIYEQSSLNLREPHIPAHEYTRIMLLALAFSHPKHVTILGLGGGCLLHALHYLVPQCTIHAIELRKKVHEVALNFFLMPTHPNINVVISDAQKAMRLCEEQSTQIIFADLYQTQGMHPFQAQKKFVLQCHRILDNGGWLVVNYHQLPNHDSSFIQCLQRYFSEVFAALSHSGNYILFARKNHGNPLSKYQTNVLDLENKLNIKLLKLFKRITRIYK